MIVAHLIGGNEVAGISSGVVIINGEELKTRYEDLVYVCGNIPLDELDTSVTNWRDEDNIRNDYIELVSKFDDSLGIDFVVDNYLTEEVVYSVYEIDFENKSLVLRIDI